MYWKLMETTGSYWRLHVLEANGDYMYWKLMETTCTGS